MQYNRIYSDIAQRTGGDIYIGVVGPVRTGKSTFIKKFMELMVLPEIQNDAFAQRARDEMPQSAAGRTIMTTEPKFVPEKAVTINIDDNVTFRTRLIDCVGYMVQGAMGHVENDRPRMVKSPWFEGEVPFDVAAETGTRKVIREHSSIGIVLTSDGSISDLPRLAYEEAEARVIAEMDEIEKPFVILLNCVSPQSPHALSLAMQMEEQYGHTVLPVNCVDMTQEDIQEILKAVLFEFPIREIAFDMPRWITLLEQGNWLQQSLYNAAMQLALGCDSMKDLVNCGVNINSEYINQSKLIKADLGTGCVMVEITLLAEMFYKVLSDVTGLCVTDEATLMPCVMEMAKAKVQYEKMRNALEQMEATGYGIVMPTMEELVLAEPEIVNQGGRYGVRLCASAPSIHNERIKQKYKIYGKRWSEELYKNVRGERVFNMLVV